MNRNYKTMGNRIKQRRKELDMTQANLAELIGTSDNHLSSIETGVQTPSFPVFLEICNKLQVRPDYLSLGDMHSNNIEQNIIDTMHLCSQHDLEVIQSLVNYLAEKNRHNWTNPDNLHTN